MEVKLICGGKKITTQVTELSDKIIIKFPFFRPLLEEIKAMEGARWNPEEKCWTFKNTNRNKFQFRYLKGENPYAHYDVPLCDIQTKRPLYQHQKELAAFIHTRKQCIIAAEMGCLHPSTQLRCIKSGMTKSVEEWSKGEYPCLTGYDKNGNIVMQPPSRIFEKEVDSYIEVNGNLIVGNNHLFLTLFKGELCLTLAENLTKYHCLITDKSSGIGTTFQTLTPSKRLTGSESGTATAQSIAKTVITAANYILRIMDTLPSFARTYSVQRFQLMEKLSSLENLGLKFQQNPLENFQQFQRAYNDISSVDCSMLMDQLVSIDLKAKVLQISISLYATLQEIFSIWLPLYSNQESFKDMELIKFQSMVEADVKFSQISFTSEQQDSYDVKQKLSDVVLSNPILSESIHLIPAGYHNLLALEIKSIQSIEGKRVFDLTMPGNGNYFDAAGINHQNTGKSLALIEAMEMSGTDDWWYAAPLSAIASFKYELMKWRSKVIPSIFTYEEIKKVITNWTKGKKAPKGIAFDECSRLKNPTAQRSQAAYQMAEGIRQDWGMEGYVVEMSGSPAPKSPMDWWHLCEIACPGFLREGTIHKFKERLAIVTMKESIAGGSYPELVSWRDDDKKCDVCGKPKEDVIHTEEAIISGLKFHGYVPGRNEVLKLYERMKGLVIVKFKKDCLDLPEKIYKVIQLPVSDTINRAAKLIMARANTVIEEMTLLRELSDGFQYKDKVVGKQDCPNCHGKRTELKWIDKEGEPLVDPYNPERMDEPNPLWTEYVSSGRYVKEEAPCGFCNATGSVDKIERDTIEVESPKIDALENLLEEHEEVGRLVVYAAYTGSLDRIVKLCHKNKWHTIRVDGRGWFVQDPTGKIITEQDLGGGEGSPYLKMFQDMLDEYPQVCFIGHPGSAGMGLTLTKSPTIVYYSNDFNAESRIQSEDRIHRAGMDVNRGATIIDLFHLPSDKYVLDNLKKKRDLQNLSLGEVKHAMDDAFNGVRIL